MTRPVRPRAVILAAACYSDAEAALTASLGIARVFRAEVLGLFTEETADIAAGRLAGGAAPSSAALRRAAQADADAFRRRLEAAAATASIACRFESRAGRAADVVGGFASPGDIVIYARRPAVATRGVTVLVREAEDDDAGAAVAELLAGAQGVVETLTLDPAEGGGARVDGEALTAKLGRRAVSAVVIAPGAARRVDLGAVAASARAPVIVAAEQGEDLAQ